MARDWSEVRLALPGTERQIRTMCVPDPFAFDPSAFDRSPIVIAHGAGVRKLFDAHALTVLYGEAARALTRIVERAELGDVHAALAAMEALPADAAEVLTDAEAAALAGPLAEPVVAALLAALIEARLWAALRSA